MENLDSSFKPNYNDAKSNKDAIYQGNNYRITVLSEALIRFEFSEIGYFEDRPTEFAIFRNFSVPKLEVQENEKYLVIKSKYFTLQYEKGRPFAGTAFAPDINLKVTLNDTDKVWYYGHDEARNFVGHVNSLDTKKPYVSQTEINLESKKQKKITLKGKFKDPTFKLKGLYSTDGFCTIDDSNSLIIDENGAFIREERPKIDLYLFMYKRDFAKCLQDYFKLTGYPPLISRYLLGIWWNKTKAYDTEEIQKLVQDFNRYKIPLSLILLGDSWHVKDENNLYRFKSGFTFNQEAYPNPKDLIKYLHDRGVRIGLNIDPSEGINIHERNYEEFAASIGIKEKQLIPFNVFDKNFMANYFKILVDPLLDMDVDMFWLDYYTKDRKSLNALNYYHMKDMDKNKKKRPAIMSRISDVAPHRYGINYSGETLVSWNTLSQIPYYNSMSSNIGLSWWSHDIGGYKNGIEDYELYIRYVQLGVFSPIFRLSCEPGHFYKRKPWKWDINTYSIVRDYCQLRHRLVPYLYGEAYKYHKSGLPLIQPLYYAVPEIYDESEYKNEYFFGTEMLIAPITKPKDKVMQRSVEKVYLPIGTWYDFKTGKKFIGDKRYILFYKNEDYPVFVKSGAIICMADLEENLNVTNSPETMEVHVFPGKSNIYNLFEDDGLSTLYEDGYYIVTRFDYNYLENNYTLIVRPFEGKSGIIPPKRNYRIRFRNTRECRELQVLLENVNLEYVAYEDNNDFVVEVPKVDTSKQLTIICKGRDIDIDTKRIINDDIDSIINDLEIPTSLKNRIADIMYSDIEISRKRVYLKKLHTNGLDNVFIKMFLKLLDYMKDI